MSPFRRWFRGLLNKKTNRVCPMLLRCEDRLAPAVATLSAGTLTIDYTATGTTSELVTLNNNGTNISLTGNVSGATANPVGSISKIVVQDSGGGTRQELTIAGIANYSLADGLQIAGADTVTINRGIDVSGFASVSLAPTTFLKISADLSLADGDLTLDSQDVSLYGSIITNGDITLNIKVYSFFQYGGTIQAPTGALTINSFGQPVIFTSFGNNVAQLVVSNGSNVIVTGSFPPSGFVQVDGVLGGSGSIGVVTVSGTGKVIPDGLTTGNIVFNSGSIFDYWTSQNPLTSKGTISLNGATLQAHSPAPPFSNQVFKLIDNQGAGDVIGAFAGYGEGATVVADGITFTLSYHGGDGNDVTLTAPTMPPRVNTVTFGDGTNQRSMVRQMVVNFSEPVTFVGNATDAFTLYRSGPTTGALAGPTGNVTLNATPNVGSTSSVTITFSGSLMEYSSLRSGFYDFTIDATKVVAAGGQLDGDSDGIGGDNYAVIGNTANKFFRIFGDGDGNGIVNLTDFASFRKSFNTSSNAVFDFDDDGIPGLKDFGRFLNGW